MSGINFEATGNLDEWPKNVPGKPTQAAVFGVYHQAKGLTCEILWTGKFDDLEPAIYWAAKKEMQAVRKGKWNVASRVIWQHDLTPEQAVAVIHRQMEPQLKQAIQSAQAGEEIDIGTGPLRPIKPGEAKEYYVELVPSDNPRADPLASWITDTDPREIPHVWAPNDPRDPE
jgi:hypothetical protein